MIRMHEQHIRMNCLPCFPAANSGKLREQNSWFSSFKLMIVAMLLVIGGIETNPGPNVNEISSSSYKKTSGFANMAGELFEVRMSALLFLRGLQSHQAFHITSNMESAGSFDDVTFTLGEQTHFLQLKHRDKEKFQIPISQLLRVKGDFSLLKYCKSFLKMKKEWQQDNDLQNCGRFENSLFIVFTNASLVEGIGVDISSADVHDLVNTNGKYFCFTEEHDKNIYHIFENLAQYRNVLSEAIRCDEVQETPELLEVIKNLHNNSAKHVPAKTELVKLSNELASLEDLSGYKEFLSRLCFYTEQSSEKNLDKLIRQEIEILCGTDKMYEKFLAGVQYWWKNSNVYLTECTNFWQDIVTSQAADIFKVTQDKIFSIDIKFKEREYKIMREKLLTDNKILFLKTSCLHLSCIKVLQCLKSKIVVDVNTLKTRLKEVIAIWKLGTWGDILVLEEWIDCNEINSVLDMFTEKKVIAVLYDKLGCDDTFNINQLEEESINKLLDQTIMFQGFPIRLGSVAHPTTITADVIIRLLSGHSKLEIGTALDSIEDFYISRTFLRRELLSNDILSITEHILAVTGLSVKNLKQIVPAGMEVKKYDINGNSEIHENPSVCNITDKECNYFVIDGLMDFKALCELYNNIHWIHKCSEGFVWKYSKGDMIPVINCLTDNITSYTSLEQVSEWPQQVVLVVAQAGMGKSIELTHVGCKLKLEDPTMWVVRIDLREHIDHKKINILQLLFTAANLNSEFERCLFEYEVNHRGNIIILIDGFDEISPKHSDKVLLLLKDILATHIKCIWITSRHIMKEELEKQLCTLSFDLKSFTKDEQKDFFLKFWNVSADRCHGFINAVVELTEDSLGNRIVEFMGIPLQTRMLAEVFQSEAMHYSETGEMNLPLKLDLLILYQRFMNRIWDIYYKKMKLDVDNVMIEEMYEQIRKDLQRGFMCCALVTLLDDDLALLCNSEKIQQENYKFLESMAASGDRRGIVINIKNGRAVFFHQTFAEYFAALWFSENYRTESTFFRYKYTDEKFELVRHFFDRILCENFDLHIAVLNRHKSVIDALLLRSKNGVNVKDKGGRTALHLAIINSVNQKYVNDYNNIIQVLLDNGAECNITDEVLGWKPLQLAEEIRAWSAVGLLLENRSERDLTVIPQNLENKELLDEVSKVAALHGYVQLVNYLLQCGVKVQRLISGIVYTVEKGWVSNHHNILHLAARHGHLKLVEFLIIHEANINAEDKFRSTPLLYAISNRHFEVAKFLISEGATFNDRDLHGYSPLLLAAEKGMGELVKMLITLNASVKIRGVFENTVLHFAAEYCDEDCIKCLLDTELDINCKNRLGKTPIICAASKGNLNVVELLCNHNVGTASCTAALFPAITAGHLNVVKCLVQYGADLTILNSDKDSLLHEAAKNGHLDIVKYLIENKADVLVCNAALDTPLHMACENGNTQIAEYLLQHRANVSASNLLKDTPLHVASDKGHIDVVKCLVKYKSDLKIINKARNTALHVAAGKGHLCIVCYLIENGASFTVMNREGDSPLRVSVRKGHLKVLQWLNVKKADKTALDKRRQTSLHIAAEVGAIHIVKWLVEQGESTAARDSKERIPLHKAARWGHPRVAHYLSRDKDSLNAQDKDGQTPLHIAAQWGHAHVVKCLLEQGANIKICNKRRRTALQIAKGREVISLLRGKHKQECMSSD